MPMSTFIAHDGTETIVDAKPGLSEAFFEALTASANYGSQFANRIIVACP